MFIHMNNIFTIALILKMDEDVISVAVVHQYYILNGNKEVLIFIGIQILTSAAARLLRVVRLLDT